MKQLRILTGRHAGARLRLTHQRYTLGAGNDTDVQISDWKHTPVVLMIDECSDVIRMAIEADDAQAGRATALEDFVPRRFGDIVLCVGSGDDNAWPGDVELLQRLMRPARNRAQAGAPSGRPPLQVRVAGALAREGLNGLSAEAAGDAKVVVSGLVNSHREIERAHAVLREFGETAVVNRYASADDLTRSISDALADASLNVRYEGSGVFLVQGAVRDVDALHSIVGRIGSDIGPLVKRIDIDVKELPPAERAHLDAMLMSPDLQYVQTPDGTKHLVVVSTAASDSSADR